jgi:hypothetical protein
MGTLFAIFALRGRLSHTSIFPQQKNELSCVAHRFEKWPNIEAGSGLKLLVAKRPEFEFSERLNMGE